MKKQKLNKEEQKERQKDTRLYNTYGITLNEFKEMAKDGCSACGRKEGRLCVDHIHQLGFKKLNAIEKRKYIRGVACFLCNTSFRVFERTKDGRRNREMLEGTYNYFKRFKLKGEV